MVKIKFKISIFLFVGVFAPTMLALFQWQWVGSSELHTIMEVVATLLALIVGALALLHYRTKRNDLYLFLGAGFLGTAFLDGYHMVITSSFFMPFMPSDQVDLIPWSWVASRQFLSIMLFLSWLNWWQQKRHPNGKKISEKGVYYSTILFTLVCFCFFAFFPLPPAHYPELFFHRPEEFVPALFFAIALIGFLKRSKWQTDVFQFWLVLSIIIGLVTQIVFMSHSNQLFDFEFDMAHLLKKISYICVLVGLMVSILRTFKHEIETVKELAFQKQAIDEHAIVSIANKRGDITYINDKFCEVSGYRKDELMGQNHRLLKSDEHDTEFYADLWNTIASGKTWNGILKNTKKDGSFYWVNSTITPFLDDEGKPAQYISIRTDITENKEVERALEKSQSRFKRSQSFAHIGTWDWDIMSGDLYWTNQISALFGGKVGSIETSYDNFLAAIHPEDREMVVNAVNACVENNDDYDIEHRVVWPDGSVHWLHESGDVVRDEDGNPLNMLGVVRDVTLRKDSDKKLIIAKEDAVRALEEAKRANTASQAKSDFLATMSHEIRTPLNAIIGFAEALEMGIGAEVKAERNERLGIIANSGRQLNNLISDILDFSKVEAGKLELNIKPVLASNIFEKCLPTIKQLAKSRDVSIKGIKKSNVQILVDPTRLEQIIINFISNATKYNKPKGSIEFGCYETSDNMIRIYVKDTGIGIPKDKEGLIFSPFDRINHNNSGIGGIGLGLAICKKLTESMNGTIGYETQFGQGSTFWVEFPAYKSQDAR